MFKDSFKVGDDVVVKSGFHRNGELSEGKITAIGRKWITVKTAWLTYRFDTITGHGEYSAGLPPVLYRNREEFEAQHTLSKAWNEFQRLVRGLHNRPGHVTLDDIAAITAMLNGPAK